MERSLEHRQPASEVAAWADRIAGPVRRWTDATQEHEVTWVFRGEADGAVVFLKHHRHVAKYRGERHVYLTWGPTLGARFRIPVLLGADDGLQALLLSEVPGDPLDAVDPALHAGAYREAGRFLAAFHALPFTDRDPVSLADALVQRAEQWCAAAAPYVDAGTVAIVRDAIGDGSAFAGMRRVPCHRDFSPRNWRVTPDGVVSFFDFEHARPDLWLNDLVRMIEWELLDHPERAVPFYDGYGRAPEDADADRLRRLSLLEALSTVAWARDHGDGPFERAGRAALARLLQG